jgi:hypothetical protein
MFDNSERRSEGHAKEERGIQEMHVMECGYEEYIKDEMIRWMEIRVNQGRMVYCPTARRATEVSRT